MPNRGYIEYLKQVLNLEDVLLAPQAHTFPLTTLYNSQADLCFVTSLTQADFMTNYKELFEKMILAMGETEDSICLFFNNPANLDPLAKKIFVDLRGISLPSELGKWQTQGPCLYLSSYSLQDIKQNLDLKRMAWKHLQDVMKEISLLRSRPLS